MSVAAIAVSSTIRARMTCMNSYADLEERSAARLANRESLARPTVYRTPPPEDPCVYPVWNHCDDATLVATAREGSARGAVHWGDVANAVHRSSGVVCTAAECKERYAAIVPQTLLAEARSRPSWFSRLSRRGRKKAPAPSPVGVATPCDEEDGGGPRPLPKSAYRG